MRSPLALLTIAALALHLTLGCHWHHAHAEEQFVASATPCASGHRHAHTGGMLPHHHGESSSDPLEDEDHDDCDAADCVYVFAAKVLLSAPANSAFLPSTPLALPSPAGAGGATLRAPPEASAAVRPHLLYQVWLI